MISVFFCVSLMHFCKGSQPFHTGHVCSVHFTLYFICTRKPAYFVCRSNIGQKIMLEMFFFFTNKEYISWSSYRSHLTPLAFLLTPGWESLCYCIFRLVFKLSICVLTFLKLEISLRSLLAWLLFAWWSRMAPHFQMENMNSLSTRWASLRNVLVWVQIDRTCDIILITAKNKKLKKFLPEL